MNKSVTKEELVPIAEKIVDTLVEKDEQYGSSWKKRGGVGAFMMAARKWDRLETFLSADHAAANKYDIFERALKDLRKEGIESDIGDLIGYLLLIQLEIQKLRASK